MLKSITVYDAEDDMEYKDNLKNRCGYIFLPDSKDRAVFYGAFRIIYSVSCSGNEQLAGTGGHVLL